MRNWNRSWQCISQNIVRRFQRTYEELKPISLSRTFPLPTCVFSVPMRNWNLIIVNLLKSNLNVFSVPMRNWNGGVWMNEYDRKRVFSVPMRNWNYIGLSTVKKRSSFSAYLWGIETRQNIISILTCQGFQRTYEELKLFLDLFPVPYRAWFSAYLWGIETEQLQQSCQSQEKFSAYLWGIETTYI